MNVILKGIIELPKIELFDAIEQISASAKMWNEHQPIPCSSSASNNYF